MYPQMHTWAHMTCGKRVCSVHVYQVAFELYSIVCVHGDICLLFKYGTAQLKLDSCVFTDFFSITHQHSRVFYVQLACLVTARQITCER